MTCERLLAEYSSGLATLKGKVDLIVGGPPCQGFSTAGKRNPNDPRNRMAEQYLQVIKFVQPRFIVIENVAGFNMKFESKGTDRSFLSTLKKTSYASYIKECLIELGYRVSSGVVNCAHFGVPQNRNRFIMIGERNDAEFKECNHLEKLLELREPFLTKKGLPLDRPVNVYEAISDLEVKGKVLIKNVDCGYHKYVQIPYKSDLSHCAYQRMMYHEDNIYKANSLRLAAHRPETVDYFKKIQTTVRPGKCLSKKERESIGTKKHSLTVLDKNKPAPTVTTLPDDILHYDEPRILTVRENARIQSFPDWFEFQGKYTTGGKQRKLECPRYTQVGNAVPPLLSEAIGLLLKNKGNKNEFI